MEGVMIDTRQIHSLTDFLRNHKEHITRLKESRRPEVLTVNGKAELVLLDAETYQEMADQLAEKQFIQAIQEGLEAAERGELKPAAQVFSEMKARYGIPD
jgi:PHD/YefM family antitoxin component YafN of YafNO toxin-antitoxin module